MTLLAGASGELGTSLANATPRLMEIAKAANKLNPALGSTAFMYESIATGVKRAQPLILDNLGLTLKVGEANEAYAKSMGITVEQMTAQDKAMAILNATLEAGDTLIDQVGGTTEAATDSFDQLEVAMKESADIIKKNLAPFLAKAATALNLLLTRAKKLNEFLHIHEEEVRDTSKSYAEYAEEMVRAALETHRFAFSQDEANLIMEEGGYEAGKLRGALIYLNEAEWESNHAKQEAIVLTARYTQGYEELIPEVEGAIEVTDEFAEILLEQKSAADKARESNKKFLDGIDRDLASPIDDFVKDIKWFLATGGQFEAAWARIQALAKTAPEEALGMAQELLVMIEDSRVELNMTTGDEAAQNIADTLGIELEEAYQKIAGTNGLQESMAGLGDIYIDLSELERMEATTLRILQNLTLMRTTGIGVGVPGIPYDPSTPTPTPSGGGTSTPSPSGPLPPPPPGSSTGGSQQYFNFTVGDELDIEEVVERVAQRVAEN